MGNPGGIVLIHYFIEGVAHPLNGNIPLLENSLYEKEEFTRASAEFAKKGLPIPELPVHGERLAQDQTEASESLSYMGKRFRAEKYELVVDEARALEEDGRMLTYFVAQMIQ